MPRGLDNGTVPVGFGGRRGKPRKTVCQVFDVMVLEAKCNLELAKKFFAVVFKVSIFELAISSLGLGIRQD